MIEEKHYEVLDRLPKRISDNYVLVKLNELNNEKKNKSGIFLTSGASDVNLDSNDIFDQVDRSGTIEMVSNLYFNPNDPLSLGNKTEMEVQKGDKVWALAIDSNMAYRFKVDNFYYKMIRYDGLTVAKRGEQIIPLNGWLLLDFVIEKSSPLIVNPFKVKILDQGVVKYMGSKNSDYTINYGKSMSGALHKINNFSDDIDVKVGDRIQYELVRGERVGELKLESDYINTFGELLKLCQRRHVIRTI